MQTQTKKLVRNEFVTQGKFDFPIIRKQEMELDKIKLMTFSNTKYEDKRNKHKTIHFFIHDYRFENTYSNPELYAWFLDHTNQNIKELVDGYDNAKEFG